MTNPFHALRADRQLSDFALDQALLEERGPRLGKDSAEQRNATDETRLAELRAFENTVPSTCPALLRPPAPKRTKWRMPWVLGTGFAGIAMATAAVMFIAQPLQEDPGKERRKGAGVRLGFWVKHGDAVRVGDDREVVHPGDSIRFSVTTDAPSYVTVLSLDAEGTASVYFPNPGDFDEPQSIDPGNQVALPIATRLDNVVGEEQVIGIFCKKPVDPTVLQQKLTEEGLGFSLPSSCDAELITFDKRARP